MLHFNCQLDVCTKLKNKKFHYAASSNWDRQQRYCIKKIFVLLTCFDCVKNDLCKFIKNY